ncbi:MAG: putative Rrf2 family DNA-binding protein [Evtepia sp.]|nr:putative Rrf2 family DNA-binding protein [Evtepia sp.]
MLITKETDYALRILRALTDGVHLTAEELARNEQIPKQFAYKILKKLQKGGIIHILRGAGGGYVLATELEKVTLYRLMQIMEEGFSVSSCMKPSYQCEWRKAHGNDLCHAHNHLSSIQKKLNEELDTHSLQKILFGE